MQTKRALDLYLGGMLMGILFPWAWLIGRMFKRDHSHRVRGGICFIKLLGGGSLVIAYPAILGLKRQYPTATFSLICSKGIKPFAELLDVFDRVDEIEDSSLYLLVKSAFKCLFKNIRVDTVVDFEVYSRLSTVLSTLTCARNRIGFYLDVVFWRRRLYTHLIYSMMRNLVLSPSAIKIFNPITLKWQEGLGFPEPRTT